MILKKKEKEEEGVSFGVGQSYLCERDGVLPVSNLAL